MATGMERAEPPLIVIYGPTASGKTDLAIRVARELDGEIICADSRTVYRELDIGTAKPTVEQRSSVQHWGVDLVSPDDRYTVVDFQAYAEVVIADIRARGKVPILVGGTGLYVDAVLFRFNFNPENLTLRQALSQMDMDELLHYSQEYNIKIPNNYRNKRYLIRTIEQNGINEQRLISPINNSVVVSIATGVDILKKRIIKRSHDIVEDNVVDEYMKTISKYGDKLSSLTGNAYLAVNQYVGGALAFNELETEIARLDYQLVRRQMMWLRRNPFILWGELGELENYLVTIVK